jgi:transposase
MALGFKVVEREQPMLLPPDLQDWLPADHLARLVLEVVDQLDLSAIESRFQLGGVGREAFHPRLLTGLLIYAYCVGVRSSRQMERLCATDVAFRVISAQQHPDHTTLARFRQRHAAALADLFGQVLAICGRAGMGRVGIVAIDGTKIAGQASPRKNYSESTLRKMAADVAAGVVADAERTDAAEDAEFGPDRSGDELPEELRPGRDRKARIRQALAQVEAEKVAAAAADVAAAERKVATARRGAQRERRDQTRQRAGRRERADRAPIEEHLKVRRADARVATMEADLARARSGEGRRAKATQPTANISDPESHIMFVRGKGFLQGYNAQLAVSDDHLIVATGISADTSDMRLFSTMLDHAVTNTATHLGGTIGVAVADAGYCSREALLHPGPDRLIATGRKPDQPAGTGKDPAIAAMAARLADDSSDRAIYRRRQATVEPVIGHLKDRLGLRRFMRRGKQAAGHELAFAALAHNILRLAAG